MTDQNLPLRRPDEIRTEGDATGGIIPYKNPKALIAYYCGIFSLMPCIGVGPGIAGVVLGIMGLKHRALHPETRGSVHAWIGIILGGGMTLIWTLVAILVIVASMQP
jgi:hypothetical protein